MNEIGTGLIALATATITGGVALIGVYLTNKANTERLKLQLSQDLNEKNRAQLRDRAEELYELTDEWLKGLFVNYMNLACVMQGKFDYNTYLDQIIKHSEKSNSNFTRLEMILNVYFPDLNIKYEEITKLRTKINEIAFDHKQAYVQGDCEGTRFLKPFTDAQTMLEKHGDIFKREIAQCAKNA